MTNPQIPMDARMLRTMLQQQKDLLTMAQEEREAMEKLAETQEVVAGNVTGELGDGMAAVMGASAEMTRVGLKKHLMVVDNITHRIEELELTLGRMESNLVLPTMTRPPNTPRRN